MIVNFVFFNDDHECEYEVDVPVVPRKGEMVLIPDVVRKDTNLPVHAIVDNVCWDVDLPASVSVWCIACDDRDESD